MQENSPDLPPVGLWRRLAAIFYDALVIVACLFIVTAIVTAYGVHFGKAHYPIYSAGILFLVFLYFAWCWVHGGQTIGMKVWKFRLVSTRQNKITWFTSISRYGSAFLSWACLGLGFFWVLFNRKKIAWHDYLSETRLVRIDKPPPK